MRKQILKGTLILTVSGIITRLIGLYNRVFLANLISASELGLYQLIFPVMSVCMAICCYGIEAALSKMIAALSAGNCPENMIRTMRIGIACAFLLAIAIGGGVYIFAEPISIWVLREPSCAPYLRIMALAIPCSTVHSCIMGYFFGIQKTTVPAFSQLLEQLVRVGTIYGLSRMVYANSESDARIAVWGLVAGEAISCIFSIISYSGAVKQSEKNSASVVFYARLMRNLYKLAYPLTVNRLFMTALTSVEAVLIPIMLKRYYGDSVFALEIFGIVTGMAFPFIMFPTTLTTSLSTMLMPAVSKAGAQKDYKLIQRAVSKCVHYCLLIGILAMAIFFVYGNLLGMLVFKNETAGYFLKMFSFLCPFIYISSTFSGTLNGLGKVKITLLNNVISLTVRIVFLIFIVPKLGVMGYLWGMMAGYLVLVVLNAVWVFQCTGFEMSPLKTMIFPGVYALMSSFLSLSIYKFILHFMAMPVLAAAGIACGVLTLGYAGMLFLSGML